jgi:hypothetical protein
LTGAVVFVLMALGLAWRLPATGRSLLSMIFGLVTLAPPVRIVVSSSRPRPAAFLVDPGVPAFRVPPSEVPVLTAVLSLWITAGLIISPFWSRHPVALRPVFWVLAGILTALAVLAVAVTWRDVGVHLRPEGLVDPTGLGTLTVPWDALAAGGPPPRATAGRLALTIARPQLVRRRRCTFGSWIRATGVDPVFLAYTIWFYSANPEHRPLIGAQIGYEELLRALAGPTSGRPDGTAGQAPH